MIRSQFLLAPVMLALLGAAFQPTVPAQAGALAAPDAAVPAPLDDTPLLKEFPRRSLYQEIIKREAASHGLPPGIADAVVRIESGYNPSAVGGVGEIGLMQVRPTTAAMLGFKGSNAELAQPEDNIRYGVAYLAKAWRLAGGDICRALMKYRAGHGEETMTPLSAEYCRRAKVHLAALGWSVSANASADPLPRPKKSSVRMASAISVPDARPKETPVTQGPKIVSVRSSSALLAANRARIADAWNRISIMRSR
ncbi:lytic transglycosylase domain-containing protein [Microvirga arabica]|uniref:lytic transglycosylase domain-containing protein n=1 Tax=Microvirga arabica TaxID=1128671 RepID=UPI00193A44F1|nr:transglycosylase SLT domain-containing protein [Microvirga arabica]MBM1174465.1 transglycosylase SLT domain-containing protein [Microvirga arabica]